MASINVTVFDSTENKRVPVELPDDAPANKLIAVLIDKLKLPRNGPDGAPLSYKFHHKNSGRQSALAPVSINKHLRFLTGIITARAGREMPVRRLKNGGDRRFCK